MSYSKRNPRHSISTDKDEVIPFGYKSARDLSFNKRDELDLLVEQTQRYTQSQAQTSQPEKNAQEKPKAIPKTETQKLKSDREKTLLLLARLERIYTEKLNGLKKANRIRWTVTFCGFSLVNFSIIMGFMEKFTVTDILQTSLRDVGIAAVLAIVLAAIHFLINGSIFGWLIQKVIAADRELEPITKQIRELEKNIK